jgi:hypothetical protein
MNIKERDRRIILRVRDGETLRAIGASYGITRERVRQIARKQGVRSVRWRDYQHLDHQDIARILPLLDRGMPHTHVAETVGVTSGTVRRVAKKHRSYKPTRDEQAWTDKETAFLRKHYKTKDWSAADIAVKLGRTRDEVIGRANRLGLCKPPRNTLAERARRLLSAKPTLRSAALADRLGISVKHASQYVHIARHGERALEKRRNYARARYLERAAA